MTTISDHQTDNLVRSMPASDRAAQVDDEGRTLHGHFSVFNEWYEIDSWFEGRFLEQIAPGAFEQTLSEDVDRIKVLYDHGYDGQLGNKPLGPIRKAEEDDVGAAYEVGLIDTDYNRDFIIPATREGLLGSSFRFKVRDDAWHDPDESTDHNPEKLPERTITRLDVYEFGPVTFPANPAATAALRSGTDTFAERLLNDPAFIARFTERTGGNLATQIIEQMRAAVGPEQSFENPAPAAVGSVGNHRGTPWQRIALQRTA